MNSTKSIFIMLSKGSLLFIIISTFLPFIEGHLITDCGFGGNEPSKGMYFPLIFSVISIFVTVYVLLRKKTADFRLESLLLDTTLLIITSIPIIFIFLYSLESDRELEVGAIFAIIGLISSLVFLSIAASSKDTLTEEEKLIKRKKKYTAITLLLYLVPITNLIGMGSNISLTPYYPKLIISGIVSIFLLIVSVKRKFQLKEIFLISLPLIVTIVFLYGFDGFNYFSEVFHGNGYYNHFSYYSDHEKLNLVKRFITIGTLRVPLLQIVICLGPAAIASIVTRKQK